MRTVADNPDVAVVVAADVSVEGVLTLVLRCTVVVVTPLVEVCAQFQAAAENPPRVMALVMGWLKQACRHCRYAGWAATGWDTLLSHCRWRHDDIAIELSLVHAQTVSIGFVNIVLVDSRYVEGRLSMYPASCVAVVLVDGILIACVQP